MNYPKMQIDRDDDAVTVEIVGWARRNEYDETEVEIECAMSNGIEYPLTLEEAHKAKALLLNQYDAEKADPTLALVG